MEGVGMGLYEMVMNARTGDKEALQNLVERFQPLIKKYKRKLNYDGADTDLIICFIETIHKIPIYRDNHIINEECIVGYINKSIKNKYIYFSKKYSKVYRVEVELNLDIAGDDANSKVEDNVSIEELLDKLSERQRRVIEGIFFKNTTEVEISRQLNISRQAVNRTKNRALKCLKEYLCS